MKTALICGIGGQDGAYLARHLLESGHRVVGTSRDASASRFSGLHRLGVAGRVETVSMTPSDFRSTLQVLLAVQPDEVYNLAGQTSVGRSFEQPVETFESTGTAVLNLLEAIRLTRRPVRLFNASSGECFGDTGDIPSSETTPFRPVSPYGVAKAAAFWHVATYRRAYGIYACSGVLFNHESPLRPESFVTRKIVAAATRIASGSAETLSLGNLNVVRDWGWAPEYVVAMERMLQQETPEDFVIATGTPMTLEAFVAETFAVLGLDWRDHVTTNPALLRPSDPRFVVGDPSRAAQILNWHPRVRGADVVRRLVAAEAHATL